MDNYVKAGLAKKYEDKLNKINDISLTPKKIVYSKANDEKIERKL